MRARLASWLLLALALSIGCADDPAPSPSGAGAADPVAHALIAAAIEAHGSEVLDQAELTFTFRGTPFSIRREDGRFRYARLLADSLARTVEQVVDNDGAHQIADGREQPLSALDARRIETAVTGEVCLP